MTDSARQTRISLRQLEYFIAVVENGSFRRAADRMAVTQPTLTAQIASLERMLGLRLFERSRGGTIQSPAGRELLRDVRRVLEAFDGLMFQARSLTYGPAGTYRWGVARTIGPYLLPHALPPIHEDYHELKFLVREDTPAALEQGLLQGLYDLILTPLPVAARELSSVILFKEPLKLVLPREHRLARRSRIGENDLKGESVLTLEESHPLHSQIQRLCARFGATMRRDYEGTSLDTLRQMVVLGMGISFLPALYVRSEIRESDGLAVVPLTGASARRELALLWRSTSPARGLFREIAMQIRGIARDRLAGDTIAVR